MVEVKNSAPKPLGEVSGIVFTGLPEEESKLFSPVRMRRGAVIGGYIAAFTVIDHMSRVIVPALANRSNPLERINPETVIAEAVMALGYLVAGGAIDGFRPTSHFASTFLRETLGALTKTFRVGKVVLTENGRYWLE